MGEQRYRNLLSALPKDTALWPQQGLEPTLLNPRTSVLPMRPPRLPYTNIHTGTYHIHFGIWVPHVANNATILHSIHMFPCDNMFVSYFYKNNVHEHINLQQVTPAIEIRACLERGLSQQKQKKYKINWRGECKTVLSDDLGEKKNCGEKSWILACGLRFVWETLLWSFFRRVPLSFRELTYAKTPLLAFVMINRTDPLL